MILYLIRHAIAADAQPGQPDEDRALTPEGIAKFRRAARGILRVSSENPPQILWSSPLLRARQTAELLAQAMQQAKLRADIRISQNLAPPANLSRFLKELRAHSIPAAAAIGHEPILSDWLSQLCFGAPGRVTLKKGALAVLDLADSGPRADLLQLLQPATLRDLR